MLKGKCKECGNTDSYNFAINNGLCDGCIAEKLEQLEDENKEIRKVALKCVRLHSMTGKGLPCVTSKSGVQCSDIFGAILELKQALKGK